MLQKTKRFFRHLFHRASLSGLVGLVVVMVVCTMVAGSIQAIQQNFQGQLKLDNLKQQVAVLELEVDTQKLQNQYYGTDEYMELQARRLLDKAAPGEHRLILPASAIVAPKTAPTATSTSDSGVTPLKDRSHLEQWLYFLFSDKQANP